MSGSRKYCNDCRHGTFDMDGPYCAHPEAFKESPPGRSTNFARKPESYCGPEGKLFEKKKKGNR